MIANLVSTLEFQVFFAAGAVLALAGLMLYILALITTQELVDPPYKPRHLRNDFDELILAELDFDVTVDLTQQFLEPVTVGRRAIGSPVRHTPVNAEWMPPIGGIRIALLETPTAEYLFARRPKDQLNAERTQFIRAIQHSF